MLTVTNDSRQLESTSLSEGGAVELHKDVQVAAVSEIVEFLSLLFQLILLSR